ncbi:MAG: tetratricopeptide repeat protein [Pseudomonadota bacterium]
MTSRRKTGAPAGLFRGGLMYGAAFLGGAACMVHEISWTRLFVPAAGNSADSAAVILMAFMAGFGFGAYGLGRLEGKIERPLAWFMAAQLLIALYGAAVFTLISDHLPGLWTALLSGKTGAGVWLLRLVFSTLLVILPAALMGTVSPLLVKGLTLLVGPGREGEETALFRRRSAALLAATTSGACMGVLAAGYVLLPGLGLAGSCRAGSILNILAALLACAAVLSFHLGGGRKPAGKRPRGLEEAQKRALETPERRRAFALLLSASAAAGFVLLAMEIVWRRVLVMSFGHDTYGMSAMLLVVLAGLALGSGAGNLLLRWKPDKSTAIGAALFVLLALAMPLFLVGGQLFMVSSPPDPFGLVGVPSLSSSMVGGILQQILVASLMIGLPAFLAGAILPVLCGLLQREAQGVSLPLGRFLLANNAGAILGTAAISLVALGRLGIHSTVLVLSVVAALCGLALLAAGKKGKLRALRMGAAVGAALVAAAVLVVSGDLPRRLFLRTAGGPNLSTLFYREGRTSTVGVTRDAIDGERQLLINGVNEVTTRFVHDQSFSLLGHLGMLLHPDPRSVLIISFGGGITSGAASTHDPQSIRAVDLERDVFKASDFFKDLNLGVLAGGKLDVVIEDGRFYLLTAPEKYDVMIIDSTHPRSIDSWLLYTKEFHSSVRSRLADDGIVVQWVPLHGMSVNEYKIILATFLSVFPEAQLWVNAGFDARGFSGYSLMVGSPAGAIPVDLDRVAETLERPKVKASLGAWLIDTPGDIMDCFIASGAPLRQWTEGLPVMTDARPVIPFVTQWSKARRLHPSLLTQVLMKKNLPVKGGPDGSIAARFQDSLPLRYLAVGHLLRGDIDGALEKKPESRMLLQFAEEKKKAHLYYRSLADRYGSDLKSLLAAVQSLRGLGRAEEAAAAASAAVKNFPGNPARLFELALSHEHAGNRKKAMALYLDVLRIQPDAVPAMNNLALLLAHGGRHREALLLLMRSREEDPGHFSTWIALGKVQMMRREAALALDAFQRADLLSRGDPRIQNLMGLARSSMGQFQRAEELFALASKLDPLWEEPCFNAGLAAFSLKQHDRARTWFLRAVTLDPLDSEGWRHLAMAMAADGLWEQSVNAFLAALQLDPQSDLAWLNLGFAYRTLGNHAEARVCFEMALKLNPKLAGEILSQSPGAGNEADSGESAESK